LFFRRVLVFAFAVVVLAGAEPVAEPQDISVLMKRTAGGGFVPLEMHRALRQSRGSLFGSMDSFLSIPGSTSAVRFKAAEPIQFYLKVYMSTTDPRASFFPLQDPTKFTLFKLDSLEERREVVLTEAGLLHVNRDGGSPMLVRLFGDSSFVLAPTQSLGAGEYALRYGGLDCDDMVVFCFGVEP
jgi:hypothetical protein